MIDGAPFKIPKENRPDRLSLQCTVALEDYCSRLPREWECRFYLKDTCDRDWVVTMTPAGTDKP